MAIKSYDIFNNFVNGSSKILKTSILPFMFFRAFETAIFF